MPIIIYLRDEFPLQTSNGGLDDPVDFYDVALNAGSDVSHYFRIWPFVLQT